MLPICCLLTSAWVCRFGPNPSNANQVLIADADNEPKSPFPVPLNFQDVQKQQAGGLVTQAFAFSDNPQETLKVVSSRRQAKRERKEHSKERQTAEE